MKKRTLRLAVLIVPLLALFVAYHTGLLHRAAFAIATAVNMEWNRSSPQTIRFYFPRWACGEAQPPYLLVETDDDAAASLVGTHIRISGDDVLEFNGHYFAECRGRFKTALAMLVWEHRILRQEGWCDGEQSVTGRFFDADSCAALTPTLEQTLKIDELMRPHREQE